MRLSRQWWSVADSSSAVPQSRFWILSLTSLAVSTIEVGSISLLWYWWKQTPVSTLSGKTSLVFCASLEELSVVWHFPSSVSTLSSTPPSTVSFRTASNVWCQYFAVVLTTRKVSMIQDSIWQMLPDSVTRPITAEIVAMLLEGRLSPVWLHLCDSCNSHDVYNREELDTVRQYTPWTIKRWQNICDHNAGKSWWIFIFFALL